VSPVAWHSGAAVEVRPMTSAAQWCPLASGQAIARYRSNAPPHREVWAGSTAITNTPRARNLVEVLDFENVNDTEDADIPAPATFVPRPAPAR
jgi:hypothetical protein